MYFINKNLNSLLLKESTNDDTLVIMAHLQKQTYNASQCLNIPQAKDDKCLWTVCTPWANGRKVHGADVDLNLTGNINPYRTYSRRSSENQKMSFATFVHIAFWLCVTKLLWICLSSANIGRSYRISSAMSLFCAISHFFFTLSYLYFPTYAWVIIKPTPALPRWTSSRVRTR